MTCPNCGNNIPAYTKICPTCNFDMEEYEIEITTMDMERAKFSNDLTKYEIEKNKLKKLEEKRDEKNSEYYKEQEINEKDFSKKDLRTSVLGLCSICVGCFGSVFGFITAFIGIILGVIGLVVSINIMKAHSKKTGMTFVLSIIGTSISVLFLVGSLCIGYLGCPHNLTSPTTEALNGCYRNCQHTLKAFE
ncbi:MAG: hypothetical protein K6E47_11730 [Lachnospiraceae bacterium]|nr:hypothetical protein [Lachnospiraceae bacterium]